MKEGINPIRLPDKADIQPRSNIVSAIAVIFAIGLQVKFLIAKTLRKIHYFNSCL